VGGVLLGVEQAGEDALALREAVIQSTLEMLEMKGQEQ
jgi:hypothetical protein